MLTPKYSRRFRTKHDSHARTPTQKLVCFQLGTVLMAVPIDRVQRVLKEFTPQGMLEGSRSLLRLNSETIPIVDLSTLFFSSSEQRDRDYLIICTLTGGERLGIPTADMPTILEVPLDQFTDIPELYRQGFSSSASAIANAALEKLIHGADGKIVFYLNLEKLFSHLPAL